MKSNYPERGGTTTMEPLPGLREGDKPVEVGKSNFNQDELLKKAELAGKPGPSHKVLEQFVGDWKAEVKCWGEPGGATQVNQATANAAWIMKGLILQEDFRGEMMGKPFTGRTLLGFDNVKNTFNCVWISDVQSSIFVTEGKGEDGNKVITLKGTTSCPMRQIGHIPMKLVLRVVSPDKRTLEMFDESRNTKTMEITYVRNAK